MRQSEPPITEPETPIVATIPAEPKVIATTIPKAASLPKVRPAKPAIAVAASGNRKHRR
jgi:hypothetical protein